MNRYEQLITDWTEVMHAKLEVHKEQAEKSTRADYHKGMADGLVTGLSYAMAVLIQMERRTIQNATSEASTGISRSSAPMQAKGQGEVIPMAEKEPVIKRVVAFKCSHCGDEGVIFTDPTKPILCNKCQNVHTFNELYRASYFCECGKICKFVMESAVKSVPCHCCKKPHRMALSRVNNEFYSLDNREREGYIAKKQAPINKAPIGRKSFEKKPIDKKPATRFKQMPSYFDAHKSKCLECGSEFTSRYEGCVTCDRCAGIDK